MATLLAKCCCGTCNDDACSAHCLPNTSPTSWTVTSSGIVVTGSGNCYDLSGGLIDPSSGISTVTGSPNETVCANLKVTGCWWVAFLASGASVANTFYTAADDCIGASIAATANAEWGLVKSANKWRLYCRLGNSSCYTYLFDAEISVTDPVACDQVLNFTNSIGSAGGGYDAGSGEHRILLGVGGSAVVTPCCS